ncbi:MAG: hypothetical protein ACR2IQ_00935 [Minisyncoccia bacterium]
MESSKKKKIIIALILIIIIIIIAFLSTKSPNNTPTNTTGDQSYLDLGQLDPSKQTKNPDGTPIITGTLPGIGSETDTTGNGVYNADGTYTVYTNNNTGYTNIGTNTNNNGAGSGTNNNNTGQTGSNGNGNSYNGSNLIDLTGTNTNGTQNTDPCAKAYNDMTQSERDLCIGAPNNANLVEDNNLVLTDSQRDRLNELDRTFYRTAPALANPDVLADYVDEVKGYNDTHNKLKNNINQCVALIDQGPNDKNSFQHQASYLGIDGRTWYRGNLKNGYTPGFSRVSGSQVGRTIDIGNDTSYPTDSYYYLKYYDETSYKSGSPFIDAFSRRGGATFTTYLESQLKGNWFDRGTFLITNTDTGVGRSDPENLRQFEELFEIY